MSREFFLYSLKLSILPRKDFYSFFLPIFIFTLREGEQINIGGKQRVKRNIGAKKKSKKECRQGERVYSSSKDRQTKRLASNSKLEGACEDVRVLDPSR